MLAPCVQDGTAIYIPAVIIWLAAESSISLAGSQIVILVLIATLASVGASPTPGLVSLILLCWSAVLPNEPLPGAIGYIATIDWFMVGRSGLNLVHAD